MTDEIIKKEDLFNAIKYGHVWHSEKIKQAVQEVIFKNSLSNSCSHHFRWDNDDKYDFIYDNDCYLFVFDGKIELRCDRDNVFSSYQTIECPIKSEEDIKLTYDKFLSMTMEDEEEQ